VGEIHRIAWPERLNRLQTMTGRLLLRDGQPWFSSDGRAGALLYGPYTALPAGRHTVTLTLEYPLRAASAGARPVAHVSAGNDGSVLVRKEIARDAAAPGVEFSVALEFDLADTAFSVQFVVATPPGVHLYVKKAVSLLTEPPAP
jgi:hypothetical protein